MYNKSGHYYFDTRLSRATGPSPLFSAVTGPAYVIFSTAGVRRRNEIESKVTKRSPMFCAAVEIRWEANCGGREARQQVEARRKVLSRSNISGKREAERLPALLTSRGSGRGGNGTLLFAPKQVRIGSQPGEWHRTAHQVGMCARWYLLNPKVN